MEEAREKQARMAAGLADTMDVKLAAMMGAFLGVGGVFGAIFLASLAGSVFGMLLIARGKGSRRTAIPFGTFLAPAAIALCLYGEPLFRFYQSFLHGFRWRTLEALREGPRPEVLARASRCPISWSCWSSWDSSPRSPFPA